jgi:hypothetical protein
LFIKHGDAQPITHIIEAPKVIEEAAKESLEKAKKAYLKTNNLEENTLEEKE